MKITRKTCVVVSIVLSWVVVAWLTLYFNDAFLKTRTVIKYYPGDKDIIRYTEEHHGKYYISKYFYKNGSVLSIAEYWDNEKLSEKSFYETGELESVCPYKNGSADGIAKGFFRDGSIKFTIEYKAARRDGKQFFYYPDGNLAIEINYKEGTENKTYINTLKSFYPDGKLISSGIFNDGCIWSGTFTSSSPKTVKLARKEGYLVEVKDGKVIKTSKLEKPFERGWILDYSL